MAQLVQIAASLLILVAFALAQRGALVPTARAYLVLNLAGSSVLAVQAAQQSQLGFLLLEGVWALISLRGLAVARRSLRRPVPTNCACVLDCCPYRATEQDGRPDEQRGPG